LIGMVLGAALGLPLNILAEQGAIDPELPREAARLGNELGGLFLRLLQMVVVPLIVSSLVTGITGMGTLEQLGRLGGRTFAFYMGSSALAIATGLVFVNWIRPGDGSGLAVAAPGADAVTTVAADERSIGAILWDQLLRMVPTNPLAAAADGDMLPIIFFSLLFGVFINITGGEPARLLQDGFAAVFAVMMRMTVFVIHLAPFGVFGFMLFAAADKGLSAFKALGWYMLTVAFALAVHGFITLPLLLRALAGRSPLEFAKAMSPALLTAFSTASSNAALPLTMTSIEQRAGVRQQTSAFVLPLGATINMDGTALYEVVAVLFIAQTLGADLTIAQQMIVAVTSLLASVGAAGIPHAGTVMMVVVLGAVGLPTSAVGLILAVDRVLDMCRTTINVWSDSVCAAIMDRYQQAKPAK
ncbi:MAG: dicarboxylate/amino acid:cation symporter, partial [Lysobacterales bacterium]